MNKKDKKDHRREKRLPIKGNILVNGKMVFKCIDISEGGLYLYTGQSFKENEIVSVTLPFKGNPLTVKARVQHNQPGIGMGLQFIDLNDEQRAIIKKLVKKLTERSMRPKDQRKKILLVEDNEMSRRIYKNKLLIEGFSIIEASDGMEAIRLLKEISPDLIVLDLYTGKMDGFKVLSILKINPKWEDIPVVVFSERGTPDVIDEIIKAGADEFLSKMLTSPSKLAETVKAILNKKIKP
jgi:CheY-like chemotaxis protein